MTASDEQERIVSKLRIGAFRLGCEADGSDQLLWIYSIVKRSGAYKADDD